MKYRFLPSGERIAGCDPSDLVDEGGCEADNKVAIGTIAEMSMQWYGDRSSAFRYMPIHIGPLHRSDSRAVKTSANNLYVNSPCLALHSPYRIPFITDTGEFREISSIPRTKPSLPSPSRRTSNP